MYMFICFSFCIAHGTCLFTSPDAGAITEIYVRIRHSLTCTQTIRFSANNVALYNLNFCFLCKHSILLTEILRFFLVFFVKFFITQVLIFFILFS